jgi:RNA polymerase sigma factor (sigma-70 family)
MNYGTLFEPWELTLADTLVSRFISKHSYFTEDDFEDLKQECLIHWYYARQRYDPGRRASMRTFMARVIRNKLRGIAESRQAAKRKADYLAASFDAPLGEDDDSRTLHDEISEEDVEGEHCDPWLEIDRGIDLSKALEKLNPRQQQICHLSMEGYDVTEIARELKLSRSTIHDEKKRIREFFYKEGLEEYWR